MGRRKIDIVKVKDPNTMQVTFSKRRSGLFKKANELAILCGVEVAIVVFSPGNKPYSFGHPSVDAIAIKFLQDEPIPNDVIGNSSSEFPNIENLNQQLNDVLAQLQEAQKESKVLDEVLKEYKATELSQLKELKNSFIELQDMVKTRLSDIDISECMILLAQKPVVGINKKVTKRKRRN
ncbi:agamous-like MADS-box protein AGL29 [Cicer arietinum]|uniref:Agamous-like MADS-box protein AGL62 n=1 Tax=Cicer arietinum TaxID=3827 RepID=A0A1S2Z880_CICAR|nr:agamous-like MADS-box protein AGL62 [Cicer arietinum]